MLMVLRHLVVLATVGAMLTACGSSVAPDSTPNHAAATFTGIPDSQEVVGETAGSAGALVPSGAQEPRESATAAAPAAPTTMRLQPALRRLTSPGCCPLPFWSPDSSEVRFWDKPMEGPPGVYGIAVESGVAAFVAERPVGVHRRGAFTTRADGDTVVLTRLADGRVWQFETGGEGIVISPDESKAAWARELGRYVPGQAPPPLEHVVADLATGETTSVAVPDAYAISSWSAGSEWLLFRRDRDPDKPAVLRYDPATGTQEPLFDGVRLRTGRTSPDGKWLAVMRTMEESADRNGIYVVATDGESEPHKLELFGGFRWRDDGRLLVVPQEPDYGPMTIWQVDPASGRAERLWGPEHDPIRIAAGEWTVSPDGRRLAFRSTDDSAVWTLDLE